MLTPRRDASARLVPFTKAHGAGNDFLILDAREGETLPAAIVTALADRRRGVGFDQLIVLHPPDHPGAAARMAIHNADGSAASSCGNATRCVALLLHRRGASAELAIETASGVVRASVLSEDRVRVDMGRPDWDWRAVPLARAADTLWLPVPGEPAAVSMGNPHVTLFLGHEDEVDPAVAGPALERDRLFPDRANVGFAVVEPGGARLRLRVWERGAGLTLACGSGACAAVVNARRRGLAGRSAAVAMPGGVLEIDWRESDGHVLMTGPAVLSFAGEVALPAPKVGEALPAP